MTTSFERLKSKTGSVFQFSSGTNVIAVTLSAFILLILASASLYCMMNPSESKGGLLGSIIPWGAFAVVAITSIGAAVIMKSASFKVRILTPIFIVSAAFLLLGMSSSTMMGEDSSNLNMVMKVIIGLIIVISLVAVIAIPGMHLATGSSSQKHN